MAIKTQENDMLHPRSTEIKVLVLYLTLLQSIKRPSPTSAKICLYRPWAK